MQFVNLYLIAPLFAAVAAALGWFSLNKWSVHRTVYISVLTTFSAISSIFAPSFGGWDNPMKTLVSLMAIDYVLGIVIALVWKQSPKSSDGSYESSASLKGLFRKGAILLIVYIAVRLDLLVGDGQYIRTSVIFFFIANEGFSIIENIGIMGLPMPQSVKDAFAAIKK